MSILLWMWISYFQTSSQLMLNNSFSHDLLFLSLCNYHGILIHNIWSDPLSFPAMLNLFDPGIRFVGVTKNMSSVSCIYTESEVTANSLLFGEWFYIIQSQIKFIKVDWTVGELTADNFKIIIYAKISRMQKKTE